MTLSLSRTSRLGVFATALLYTGLTFGAATAPVAAEAKSAPYYTAELAAPTTESRAVAGGVAWNCKEDRCAANKGTSRPTSVCRGLAREFGEVKSFTAKGKELSAEKLDKCNGK
jgi:hypothetical protein